MQDPQSLHKYTYVHGDPIGGIDPSGEMKISTMVAISIGVYWSGLSAYANLRAKRSIGLGFAGGVYGSSALYAAYNADMLWPVFKEASLAAMYAVLITNLIEHLDGNALPTGWENRSLFLEGINFGSGYAMYIEPLQGWTRRGVGADTLEGFFGSGVASAGITSLVGLAGAFTDVYAMGSEILFNHATGRDGDRWKENFENAVEDYVGYFKSAILDMTAGPLTDYALTKLFSDFPGIRALPPSTKKLIAEKMVTLVRRIPDAAQDLAEEFVRPITEKVIDVFVEWVTGD